jgi:hypothetical protein
MSYQRILQALVNINRFILLKLVILTLSLVLLGVDLVLMAELKAEVMMNNNQEINNKTEE